MPSKSTGHTTTTTTWRNTARTWKGIVFAQRENGGKQKTPGKTGRKNARVRGAYHNYSKGSVRHAATEYRSRRTGGDDRDIMTVTTKRLSVFTIGTGPYRVGPGSKGYRTKTICWRRLKNARPRWKNENSNTRSCEDLNVHGGGGTKV